MSISSQTLPQLYRFCFLMTGEEAKAQAAFHDTIREAAARSAEGDPANDRLWFFREARWRCVAAGAQGAQAEKVTLEEEEISPGAPEQIAELEPEQLATWIANAPEPQRSAQALYYLDEFDYRELLALLEMKMPELSALLEQGRREFQAWLDAVVGI